MLIRELAYGHASVKAAKFSAVWMGNPRNMMAPPLSTSSNDTQGPTQVPLAAYINSTHLFCKAMAAALSIYAFFMCLLA